MEKAPYGLCGRGASLYKEAEGSDRTRPSAAGGGAARSVVVVACFVPFTKELAETNRVEGKYASPESAQAYEVTNAMLKELNQSLIGFLEERGYRGAVTPEAFTLIGKN